MVLGEPPVSRRVIEPLKLALLIATIDGPLRREMRF